MPLRLDRVTILNSALYCLDRGVHLNKNPANRNKSANAKGLGTKHDLKIVKPTSRLQELKIKLPQKDFIGLNKVRMIDSFLPVKKKASKDNSFPIVSKTGPTVTVHASSL